MKEELKIDPFLDAAIENQIDIVRQGLNDNPPQSKKDEAFGLAIAYGNLEIADLILANGANLHHDPGDNLYWACHNSQFDSVKYLVEKGVDINCQDGVVAFMLAQTGNLEIIKWIKENGADLHIKENQPLINAISFNKTDIAKYLLDEGADPNAQDGAPLREAGMKGNLEILKQLIDIGGKIEGYSEHAKKMKAIWMFKDEHILIIKYLLTLDIEEKDRNEFLLNWVINYNNRENRMLGIRHFNDTEKILKDNGLEIKMFLPPKKRFGLF